jgi:hypothetical protein
MFRPKVDIMKCLQFSSFKENVAFAVINIIVIVTFRQSTVVARQREVKRAFLDTATLSNNTRG